MDVPVELLTDDVWAAEDDKTDLLNVEVNSFGRLFLRKWPIFVNMVHISTIKQKYDK